MTRTSEFQVTSGRAVGRDHARAGRNCQDAVAVGARPDAIVVTVADGCGASPHSEVGAELGARLWTQNILDARPHANVDFPGFWRHVARLTADGLRDLLGRMPGAASARIVEECMLFTVVSAVVTPTRAAVCAIGDGVVVWNREVISLGPFPDNAPPYLGYGIYGTAPVPRVVASSPVTELDSLIVGTDGAGDLFRARDRTVGGGPEKVGPFHQFLDDDCYYTNRDALRRKLVRATRDSTRVTDGRLERIPGVVGDDVALAVVRRVPGDGA